MEAMLTSVFILQLALMQKNWTVLTKGMRHIVSSAFEAKILEKTWRNERRITRKVAQF